MLSHEEQVIQHTHVAQRELDGVARYAAPVALEPGIDDQLSDTQQAAEEVQQDLPYAPSLGAAVAEVVRELRRVLDERDQ